jgi:hypothetical protein
MIFGLRGCRFALLLAVGVQGFAWLASRAQTTPAQANAVDAGLAMTPPMGWNSCRGVGCARMGISKCGCGRSRVETGPCCC